MVKGGLGFDDIIIMSTELRLGLPGACPSSTEKTTTTKKRVFSEVANFEENENNVTDRKIQKKSQVVGWPPVCSYRKKRNTVQDKNMISDSANVLYVKVSMDGAPYLRKIDLSVYTRYSDLVVAFEKLFGCLGCICNDSDGSEEYLSIYEDKDGDWMLLGDVPWTMFTESCKRLRIMKRSDAKCYGLQS